MMKERSWYEHHMDQDNVEMYGLDRLVTMWEEVLEYARRTKKEDQKRGYVCVYLVSGEEAPFSSTSLSRPQGRVS